MHEHDSFCNLTPTSLFLLCVQTPVLSSLVTTITPPTPSSRPYKAVNRAQLSVGTRARARNMGVLHPTGRKEYDKSRYQRKAAKVLASFLSSLCLSVQQPTLKKARQVSGHSSATLGRRQCQMRPQRHTLSFLVLISPLPAPSAYAREVLQAFLTIAIKSPSVDNQIHHARSRSWE